MEESIYKSKINRNCAIITFHNHEEIFSIQMDGKIILRGKVIGKDKELAEILSNDFKTIGE
jgi:hypothetical protein